MTNIEVIRQLVSTKGFRLTGHASVEAMKDGVSPSDIRYVIFHGEIIEQYPERDYPESETCLIYAKLPINVPVHIVIDIVLEQSIIVVTAYIPDRKKWVASRRRRR